MGETDWRSSGSERTTHCPDCQCYVTLLSRQDCFLKGQGVGGEVLDCEELCWSSCQQSDRQQTKQDLINVFSLGELCFLDLNRFEGITYLPSEATPVASRALWNCSTPRKQESGWGGGCFSSPQVDTDQVVNMIFCMQNDSSRDLEGYWLQLFLLNGSDTLIRFTWPLQCLNSLSFAHWLYDLWKCLFTFSFLTPFIVFVTSVVIAC